MCVRSLDNSYDTILHLVLSDGMARTRNDMYRPTVAYQLRITRQISEHAA